MIGLMQKFKRVIAFVIMTLILFTTVLRTNTITVQAKDANALVQTYMKFMSGTKITAMEDDLLDLNENDLKVISLFLSNFYTPFGSSLEESASGNTYDTCVEIMQTLGFESDASKTLVSTVFQCALNYSSPLVYSGDDVSDTLKLDGKDPSVNATDTTYLAAVTGKSGPYTNGGGDEFYPLTIWSFWCILNDYNENYEDGDCTEIDFYRLKDGVVDDSMPVFRINHSFAVIFGDLVAKASNYTKGRLCNAMWNTSTEPTEFTQSYAFKLTPFGEAMYVDWCGNVFADMGDARVIIVPAVINTAAFVQIKDAGDKTDYDYVTFMGSTFGFNIINHTDGEDLDFGYNSKAVKSFYKTLRGSTTAASWDTANWKWGKGWASDYRTLVTENGVHAGTGDGWDAKVYITIKDEDAVTLDSMNEDNVWWDILSYNSLGADSVIERVDLSAPDATSSENFSMYRGKLFNGDSTFTNLSDTYDSLIKPNNTDTENQMLAWLFLTYVYMYAQGIDFQLVSGDDDFNIAYVGYAFGDANGEVTFATTAVTQEQIQSLLYLLLHPSKGVEYFTTWVKNKIAGLFIAWHEDIVGNTHSNVTTGMTRYVGFSGYVTIPTLSDLDFLNWMVANYDLIVIYLILVMLAILLCYVLVGQLELKRAFAGIVLFAILAFLPTRLINASINVINTFCDTIYSSKFDYWAIVQNQEYLATLRSNFVNLTSSDTSSILLQKANKSEGSDEDTFTSNSESLALVKVKWPSPKRTNDIYRLQNELASMNANAGNVFSSTLISIATNIVNTAENGNKEEYVDGANYLYRDYMDIYNSATITYNVLNNVHNSKGFSFGNNAFGNDSISIGSQIVTSNESDFTYPIPSSIQNSDLAPDYLKTSEYNAMYDSGLALQPVFKANEDYSGAWTGLKDTSSLFALTKGFLYSAVPANNNNYYGYDSLATSILVKQSGKLVKPAIESYVKLTDTALNGLSLSYGDLSTAGNVDKYMYGIDTKYFNYSTDEILIGNFKEGKALTDKDSNDIRNDTKLGYMYYGLYSESPYYFFTYNIRDQLHTIPSYSYDYHTFDDTQLKSSQGNVKDMFLRKGHFSYFYNMNEEAGDGYGYMRDFMNLHDFFYYIMPTLRQGNKSVRLFDDLYNIELYEDCTFRIDSSNVMYYNGKDYAEKYLIFSDASGITQEDLYKLWHNMNVYSMWTMYTTWLDLMYDCDYAKPCNIRVAGENFYVENPLDPTSYFELDDSGNLAKGRYMVFSQSEQHYYGLKDSDLTPVERKIIEVENNVYQKSLQLMNYYTMSDEVLIQAYSMIQTFEFNKAFSQKNVVSSAIALYPQGFELKAFSYDAYLRLIMAGSSNKITLQNVDDSGNSESIYSKIMSGTSIFYGVFLLINDVLCVYIIPLLRFIFVLILFFMSVAMIVFGAIKLYDDTGMTMLAIVWQSLVKPLLQFTGITVGLALIVSLLMYGGPNGVTATTQTISLGDPTMTLICLIVLNCATILLYFKLFMHTFKDLVKYMKAIGASVTGAVRGAIGNITKMAFGLGVAGQLKRLMDAQNSSVVSDGAMSAAARGMRNTGQLAAGVADQVGDAIGGAGSGLASAGGALGGALGGLAGEGPSENSLHTGNSQVDDTYNNMSDAGKNNVSDKDKNKMTEGITNSRQNVKDKYADLQGAKSKYDDYQKAKAEKHANTHTGKYENAREALGIEGANFKEAATAFKNSKGAAKGTAFANMVSSGAKQVGNGLTAAKEGAMSAPARFVKAKVGKHFGGGFMDGVVHAKENNLKNDVNKAQGAYDAARKQHNRVVNNASNRLNGLERQANYSGDSTDKSIARHNAKRGTSVQRRQANVVNFSAARNKKGTQASRA